jgi:hypothetical protein
VEKCIGKDGFTEGDMKLAAFLEKGMKASSNAVRSHLGRNVLVAWIQA